MARVHGCRIASEPEGEGGTPPATGSDAPQVRCWLLAALTAGRVYLFSGKAGRRLKSPYQPTLHFGRLLINSRPRSVRQTISIDVHLCAIQIGSNHVAEVVLCPVAILSDSAKNLEPSAC